MKKATILAIIQSALIVILATLLINEQIRKKRENTTEYYYNLEVTDKKSNNILDYRNYGYLAEEATYVSSNGALLIREYSRYDIKLEPSVKLGKDYSSIPAFYLSVYNYSGPYKIISKAGDDIVLSLFKGFIKQMKFYIIDVQSIKITSYQTKELYGTAAFADVSFTLGYNKMTGYYNNINRKNVFVSPNSLHYINSPKNNSDGCLVLLQILSTDNTQKDVILHGSSTTETILQEFPFLIDNGLN